MVRQSSLTSGGTGNRFSAITIGKVNKVYPEANMVEIYLFDGTIIDRVQVISGACSNKFGRLEMPVSEYEKPLRENRLFALQSKDPDSDVYAVLAWAGDSLIKPICLGFLFPEENEVLCSTKQEGNEHGAMLLWKHYSNVYVRVAEQGDIEISHPSGVLIKIGKDTERTEINNYDNKVRAFKWKDRESDELADAPNIAIIHPSGTSIKIDTEGNVEESIEGNLDRKIKGDLTENIDGDMKITVGGDVSIKVSGNQTNEVTSIMIDSASQIDHIAGM